MHKLWRTSAKIIRVREPDKEPNATSSPNGLGLDLTSHGLVDDRAQRKSAAATGRATRLKQLDHRQRLNPIVECIRDVQKEFCDISITRLSRPAERQVYFSSGFSVLPIRSTCRLSIIG